MEQQSFQLSTNHRKNTLIYRLQKKQIYGGSINYRKIRRPLSTQKSIHVVFKINDKAYRETGGFRKETAQINRRLAKLSHKFQIKTYKHAINSNHIHLICRTKSVERFSHFLRAFTGSIALYFKIKYQVTASFWLGRPFTRLVSWGREFKNVCTYIAKNFKEVVGFVPYSPRKHSGYKFIEQWTSTA